MIVFVYALIDPRNEEVKYIGTSEHPKSRYSHHISSANFPKTEKEVWIAELLALGLKPELKIIEETDKQNMYERERHWINHFSTMSKVLTTGVGAPKGEIQKVNLNTRIKPETLDKIEKKIARDKLATGKMKSMGEVIEEAVDKLEEEG